MKTLEAKSLVLLKHHLKALRLPTVGAECEKVAQRAAADNVDHLTYLLQLLELELIDREKRSADRRLKAAKFPTIKTLDAFDFTARPSVNKVLVAELARCAYIDERECWRHDCLRPPARRSAVLFDDAQVAGRRRERRG